MPDKRDRSQEGRSYGRWRAVTLTVVYLLMVLHILHWKIRGTTLAPLELNEVMYTLELGILTAGFLLMAAAVLSVLVFGRFFCSWACHILALEDLAAWILEKAGIRVRPIHSRLLLLVPPGALFYMFAWPQLRRFFAGEEMPALHLRMDGEGWASFVTSDFWRNLPGPGIALLTFAVCGFVIVYFLGTRSFCTYVCPYGAAFALADRIAPGRIRERNLGDCIGCAKCTAVCSSNVRVHEEILMHGQIIDPGCLKDLDCVSVCPEKAISFGFVRPKTRFVSRISRWHTRIHQAIFRPRTSSPGAPTVKTGRSMKRTALRARTGQRIVGRRYNLSWTEELVAAAFFLTVTGILRGLYGRIPFLLALTVAVIVAVFAVILARLLREPNVRLSHLRLKRNSRWSSSGVSFAVGSSLLALLLFHSGWIRTHEFLGERAYAAMGTHMATAGSNPPPALLKPAAYHAELVERWGLIRTPELYFRLASVYSFEDPPLQAATYFARGLQDEPDDHGARLKYAAVLCRLDRFDEAKSQCEQIVTVKKTSTHRQNELEETQARAHLQLGRIALQQGDRSRAEADYLRAVRSRAGLVEAYLALAQFYVDTDNPGAAEAVIRQGLQTAPENRSLLQFLRSPTP